MKSNVRSGQQVHLEPLGLLVGHSGDEELLARRETAFDASLIGHRIIFSAPTNAVQLNFSSYEEMINRIQRLAIFEIGQIFLVGKYLEVVVVRADSQIEGFSLLEGFLLFLLFAPSPVSEGVENGVLLLLSEADMQWGVVLSVLRSRQQIDVETVSGLQSVDDYGLTGLKAATFQTRQIRYRQILRHFSNAFPDSKFAQEWEDPLEN